MLKEKVLEIPPFENLNSYDRVIVSKSGGKDSIAVLLHMFDLGVDPSRIELHHNCVDGRHTKNYLNFDWPCTEGYIRALAKHFNLTLCWSWRDKGFQGQLFRYKEKPADILYQYEDSDVVRVTSTRGELGTRLKFPAKSADLMSRWCSSCLKIDVSRTVISELFPLKKPRKGEEPYKILYLSGERRQESTARSKYLEYPVHPRYVGVEGPKGVRLVHHWRPILDWTEEEVWAIMERYKIRPHPCYQIGFSRCSCATCIFLNNDDWATIMEIMEYSITRLHKTEKAFGFTLDNKRTLLEMASKGKSFITEETAPYVSDALTDWDGKDIIMNDWKLPAGAFRHSGGPI